MKNKIECFKEFFGGIKCSKISFPNIVIKKPSRTIVIIFAVLIELILMFVALWLFDERTQFANDYIEKRYSGKFLNWSWFRKGFAITLILTLIGWLIAIFNEFAAYYEKDRTFYKLYHRNKY